MRRCIEWEGARYPGGYGHDRPAQGPASLSYLFQRLQARMACRRCRPAVANI